MAVILVVDDESYMRGFLAELLSPQHIVLSARNGQEALLIAQSIYPNLIITDLEMPIMSGVEMVERLRKIPSQQTVPVIALSTNFYIKEERERMLAAGADFSLPKPINIAFLQRKIAQLLSLKNIQPLPLGKSQQKESYL
jgi:CheY-like chemotaxis protein